MKKILILIKPKTKYIGTLKNQINYCLACRKHPNNFGLKKVTVTNKVIRIKPKCGICLSDKSRFLKQKHNKKCGQ